jgi:hypothetical protein
MNIIPFDQKGSLPAYLKNANRVSLNADLMTATGGFPVISIKGKTFAVVRDGVRKVLPNPKDPDSPATSVDVVIIRANKGMSKVFYAKGYDKDSEGAKPDCYSNDGTAPATDAKNPQSTKCATCAHNQWGSRISDSGSSKGKACSDSRRLAVAAAGQINDPMLLRVPPASIRALSEYVGMLDKRRVDYDMVVTKVGFEVDAESPKLSFRAVGLLDEDAYAEVQENAAADIIANIIGTSPTPSASAPAIEVEAKAEAPKVEKKPAKAEPKAPTPTVENDVDFDLDGISFDD